MVKKTIYVCPDGHISKSASQAVKHYLYSRKCVSWGLKHLGMALMNRRIFKEMQTELSRNSKKISFEETAKTLGIFTVSVVPSSVVLESMFSSFVELGLITQEKQKKNDKAKGNQADV